MLKREKGEIQPVAAEIDPGSKKEGFTAKSEAHTYLNIQADAVARVKEAVETRRTRCEGPGDLEKPRAERTNTTAPVVHFHPPPKPAGSGNSGYAGGSPSCFPLNALWWKTLRPIPKGVSVGTNPSRPYRWESNDSTRR
jgi:hypothetical protein